MCNGEIIDDYGETSLTSIVNNTSARELIKIGILKENIVSKRCLELNEFDVYDGELCGTYIEDEEFNNAILYGELNIPSTINGEQINSISCFDYQDITSVKISNGVTKIDFTTFQYNNITNVTIPNSVTSIGDKAFEGNLLTSINIPNSIEYISGGIFDSNQLTNIEIPNSVTEIGDSAFSNNQLTSITIPESVTYIGSSAFAWNQLTNVTIPNSVTTMGREVFDKVQDNKMTINVIGYTSKPEGWDPDWNIYSIASREHIVNWNYGG